MTDGTRDLNANGTAEEITADVDKARELPQLERSLKFAVWTAMTAVSVFLSVYVIYYAKTKFLLKGQHTIVVLLLSFLAFFLLLLTTNEYRTKRDASNFALIVLLLVAMTGALSYFIFNYNDLLNRVLQYKQIEYVLAAVVILISIEATRRSYGSALPVFVVVALAYALFGSSLPSILHHDGLSLNRLLEMNALTLGGAFGFIPQIGATWVAIFLVYGGLLDAYGALDLFNSLGNVLSNHVRSGVAQFAVIASLLMGTITGVAAANTATTGSFTIPLMKENGIEADTAGAIESLASTGGQVMPPIMGVSAFVMASILSVPYLKILTVALLPALLYYFSLAAVVHIASIKQGIRYEFDLEVNVSERFREGLPIIISIAVLVYYIAWVRFGPMVAAFNAIVTLIVTQFGWTLVREDNARESLTTTALDTVRGLQIGGMTTARLMPALVAVAIMVEMVQVGSIIQDTTFAMLNLSGGQLLPLLILAMILSLILGMGAPTVVAYIIVAILVGPAVTQFGLDQIYGHLFVFYFAVLSSITPPFAVACLVACGISDAGFIETCREAIKLAVPIYLLPFAFVIHKNLLVWNAATLVTFLMVFVGLLSAIVSVVGHPTRRVSFPIRLVLLTGAAIILFTDVTPLNVLGTAATLGGFIYISRTARSLPATDYSESS